MNQMHITRELSRPSIHKVFSVVQNEVGDPLNIYASTACKINFRGHAPKTLGAQKNWGLQTV